MTLGVNHHRGNHLLGKIIRFLSNGRYNHTSLVFGDYVYESHIHTGVRKTHITLWDSKSVIETDYIKVRNPFALEYWLNRQVGKKYDTFGIFSFLFNFMKPRRGYWYCSELAFVAICKSLEVNMDDTTQKVSPQMLRDIVKLLNNVL